MTPNILHIDSERSCNNNSNKRDNNIDSSTTDDFSSPPPSPPPIHTLYTEGSVYRHTYKLTSAQISPTRNNKAGIQATADRKRLPLLQHPDSFTIPSTDKQVDTTKNSITKREQAQLYLRQLATYLVKQLMKKNNLAIVINAIHQAWRARFFVARLIRTVHQIATSYPYRAEYVYYRNTLIRLGKLVLLMAKEEQRDILVQVAGKYNQRLTLTDLASVIPVVQMYLTLALYRFTVLSRLGVRSAMLALKHLSAWDSLALAFTSVALTRSLQNPSHWM